MEYRDRDYENMIRMDARKMPFYMTYPMQNLFLEEAEYERDMDRMKQMYPREVQQIQRFVEDECDQMEYEGSLMFDEYPDRLMLRRICNRIFQNVAKPERADYEAEQYETMETEELRLVGSRQPGSSPFGPPPPPPPENRPDMGLKQLIEVMLYNEMYRRRCRHRRCRRWW